MMKTALKINRLPILTFRFLFLLGCFLVLETGVENSVSAQQDTSRADQDYQATLGEKRTVDVDFAVVVTAAYHTKLLKIWMPLPQSDIAQKITNRQLTTFPENHDPKIGAEKKFGNRFAYYEIPNPQGAQIIHQKFRVTVSQMNWHLDAKKVQPVSTLPASFNCYLSQPDLISKNEEFQKIIGQLKSNSENNAESKKRPHIPQLFGAMNWIDKHLTYDHVNASLQADPLFALSHKGGHCSDYHGLCAAMGRSLGYPTRVTYGLQLFPKSSPSHCKLEAYLPPYGWVSFDLSETQKLALKLQKSDLAEKENLIKKLRSRLKQGYRENSWLLVTKGSNYELAPPGIAPVKIVRTIYAEADGVPLSEPDPANHHQQKFAWMTAHKFTSQKPLEAAFKNLERLEEWKSPLEK